MGVGVYFNIVFSGGVCTWIMNMPPILTLGEKYQNLLYGITYYCPRIWDIVCHSSTAWRYGSDYLCRIDRIEGGIVYTFSGHVEDARICLTS